MSPERRHDQTKGRPSTRDARLEVSVIMPTVSWGAVFECCARAALRCIETSRCDAELVVVLDGPPAEIPEWLDRPDVRIVVVGRNSGPAIARNRAAAAARGEILFFVDADVELESDAIDLVHRRLAADPGLTAVIGTYDDEPAATGVVSQFRNLLHHHTHVAHPGRADSFWAGCGAIRAARFRAAGGFDEKFRYPSVEDIELGIRMSSAGERIELDPTLRCKHHKDWSLGSMIFTDVARRATPWTKMILRTGRLPCNLATDGRNRASGVLALLAVTMAGTALLVPVLWWAVVACLAGIALLNLAFYRSCARKRGLAFGVASFALHLLFFIYSSATFAAVLGHGLLTGGVRPGTASAPRTAAQALRPTSLLPHGEAAQASLRD